MRKFVFILAILCICCFSVSSYTELMTKDNPFPLETAKRVEKVGISNDTALDIFTPDR